MLLKRNNSYHGYKRGCNLIASFFFNHAEREEEELAQRLFFIHPGITLFDIILIIGFLRISVQLRWLTIVGPTPWQCFNFYHKGTLRYPQRSQSTFDTAS